MSTKTRDFAAKARTIVGGTPRPTSLQDFLEEDPAVNTEDRTSTASRTEDVRDTENTAIRTDEVRKIVNTANNPVAKRIEREEFKFDSALAERLRRCAFETRRKKTAIVREALDGYLKGQGF